MDVLGVGVGLGLVGAVVLEMGAELPHPAMTASAQAITQAENTRQNDLFREATLGDIRLLLEIE